MNDLSVQIMIKFFHLNTKYLLIFLLLSFNKKTVQASSIITDAEINPRKIDCTFKYDAGLKRNIYDTVDKQPEFPGGTGELYRYFAKKSELANEDYEKFGRLEIKFLIGPNGKATFLGFGNKNFESVKYLENRVRKVFEKMPRWTSGKCKGKNVSIRYTMMIQS